MTRLARAVRGAGLSAAAVVAVGAAADMAFIEPNRLTTSVVPLDAGPLASALGGARVAHLSDLHLKGSGGGASRLLATLRELEPDLIVMTGDYADTPEGIDALEDLFGRVRPRYGIFAVPGNNDYFRGRQDAILGALRRAGVRVLVNEVAMIEAPGGRVAIAGVDDPFFGRDETARTLAAAPEGVPVILLAHSPAVLAERSDALLFNAGDAAGAWGEGWFWTNGSHFRGPAPSVAFDRPGPHRLRIQRREDGAGIAEIRLVPDDGRDTPPFPRGLQGRGQTPPAPGPGAIRIDLCASADGSATTWQRVETADGRCWLADAPDAGRLGEAASPSPGDAVEAVFEAPAGVRYRIWARLLSPTATGRSDSFYLQLDDAVDASGAPRWRPGSRIGPASSPALALVLAGHTHGGQVRLPWLGPVERHLARGPYVMGRYEIGKMMVYISRGIGTSYLPVRLLCPPEVVVFVPPREEART